MIEQFKYDVFISYSSKDQFVVRELAERLRQDGLRVWFDDWEIKLNDERERKVEDGLKQSRVLALAMSANFVAFTASSFCSDSFSFANSASFLAPIAILRSESAFSRSLSASFR